MHISDELPLHAINASDGLAKPIKIEVAVADCDPEPRFPTAMAARTPKGEKVLKPMGLDASRYLFEGAVFQGVVFQGAPAGQATFELRIMASRDLSKDGCFLGLQ